jgi:hypothetical protein
VGAQVRESGTTGGRAARDGRATAVVVVRVTGMICRSRTCVIVSMVKLSSLQGSMLYLLSYLYHHSYLQLPATIKSP